MSSVKQKPSWTEFVLSACSQTDSQAKLLEAEFQLTGSDAYAARFGETIADLGDLDDDGYPGKDLELLF